MEQVTAVVVTHDRLDMLQQCIQCLRAQVFSCDVLVVDNASTDGTAEWLTEYKHQWPTLHIMTLLENTGGAGGFNIGMRRAVNDGYDYIWLMDDDCFPKPDALERLLEADKLLGGPGNYGFLSSLVLWKDGSVCLMNRQKPRRYKGSNKGAPFDLVDVEQATFVSLLLPTGTVQRFGLPIADYFIWGDDIEYTRRIAVRGKRPGYLVKPSVVLHATRSNVGSDVATDELARLDRYQLSFRNEFFTYRQEGLFGILRFFYRCMRSLWHVIYYAENHKWQRAATVLRGIWQGLMFRPHAENSMEVQEKQYAKR